MKHLPGHLISLKPLAAITSLCWQLPGLYHISGRYHSVLCWFCAPLLGCTLDRWVRRSVVVEPSWVDGCCVLGVGCYLSSMGATCRSWVVPGVGFVMHRLGHAPYYLPLPGPSPIPPSHFPIHWSWTNGPPCGKGEAPSFDSIPLSFRVIVSCHTPAIRIVSYPIVSYHVVPRRFVLCCTLSFCVVSHPVVVVSCRTPSLSSRLVVVPSWW